MKGMIYMAVTLNAKYLEPFVNHEELEAIFPQVQAAHRTIHEKSGPGNDFLGWLDLPVDYGREEFTRIQKAAQKIRSNSQVLIVIGIGGSSRSVRAKIFRSMSSPNQEQQPNRRWHSGFSANWQSKNTAEKAQKNAFSAQPIKQEAP